MVPWTGDQRAEVGLIRIEKRTLNSKSGGTVPHSLKGRVA